MGVCARAGGPLHPNPFRASGAIGKLAPTRPRDRRRKREAYLAQLRVRPRCGQTVLPSSGPATNEATLEE